MSKEKKRKKKKKVVTKANISLTLSIIAILISVLSLPLVNKYFDKPNIEIIDKGFMKTNDSLVQKNYLLINNSKNTAKNIHLYTKELDYKRLVFFAEKGFVLEQNDYEGGKALNRVYKLDELAPGEKISFVIYVDFKNYLKVNGLDTMIVNKPISYPYPYYGPYVMKVKHSNGIEKPNIKSQLTLTDLTHW